MHSDRYWLEAVLIHFNYTEFVLFLNSHKFMYCQSCKLTLRLAYYLPLFKHFKISTLQHLWYKWFIMVPTSTILTARIWMAMLKFIVNIIQPVSYIFKILALFHIFERNTKGGYSVQWYTRLWPQLMNYLQWRTPEEAWIKLDKCISRWKKYNTHGLLCVLEMTVIWPVLHELNHVSIIYC